MKPLALDLFCKAGGASMGLSRAGFDVVGVDIERQPRYPFTFVQADALNPPFDLARFDFIWASPPCQFGSGLTPKTHRANHINLIPQTRAMLRASGRPYAIENVAGVRRHLMAPIMLCGSMFGLRTQRHRYFETSFRLFSLLPACDHRLLPLLVTTASAGSRRKRKALGMAPKSVANAPVAYGIDWMDAETLREAIPPAYSEYIGREAVKHISARQAA